MAKKSQADNSLRTPRKGWKRLWAKSGRAERIEARVKLGKEALELEKRTERDLVLKLLTSVTRDRARAHHVLRVAQLRKRIITYATREARRGNCMSWTHLADIASIAKQKTHDEIARRCVHERLSVAKLRQVLTEEYAYVPGQGRIRVTELAVAFHRELRTLSKTAAHILSLDEGKSFIEAAKKVKPKHQDAAIRRLGEALELLKELESNAVVLERSLTRAKKRLETVSEWYANLQE